MLFITGPLYSGKRTFAAQFGGRQIYEVQDRAAEMAGLQALADELAGRAREACEAVYGNAVFARGLIEFTNVCKNDCYYCGIRKSNQACQRYLLSDEDILTCCAEGYQLGFRT